LTFYEDYFQIPFPLPKQDMVALKDLSFGGMENWGMITYRYTYHLDIENTGIPIYILAVAFKLIGKLLCFLTLSSHPSRTSRELLRLSPMSWPINGKL
jgi:hypothetical protein